MPVRALASTLCSKVCLVCSKVCLVCSKVCLVCSKVCLVCSKVCMRACARARVHARGVFVPRQTRNSRKSVPLVHVLM